MRNDCIETENRKNKRYMKSMIAISCILLSVSVIGISLYDDIAVSGAEITVPDVPEIPYLGDLDENSLVLLAILIFVIFLILLRRKKLSVRGMVTCEGDSLNDAKITYILNGVEKSVKTNKNGFYHFKFRRGSNVIIISSSKDGFNDQELSKPFFKLKKSIKVNFWVTKKTT